MQQGNCKMNQEKRKILNKLKWQDIKERKEEER
jgi:hypothetical protein